MAATEPRSSFTKVQLGVFMRKCAKAHCQAQTWMVGVDGGAYVPQLYLLPPGVTEYFSCVRKWGGIPAKQLKLIKCFVFQVINFILC